MTQFNLAKIDTTKENCFFGNFVNIARFDVCKYSMFDKLTRQQIGFFWVPDEVDLSREPKDFKSLDEHAQHIFTSNLKRQILLDSVQGRAPSAAFLPLCSLPELETFIQTWTFFETIHSRSYTHIIRNLYSNPSKVFDEMMDIKEIVDCAKDISKYYDSLIRMNNLLSEDGNNESSTFRYEHKKALWLCLNAVNALEGIRFYVSFACSWAFAEVKKMEGNAKIIKFIARDENIHLAFTQQLLKILPQEDAEFKSIKEQTTNEVEDIFSSVISQEKEWAKYLFQHGSILGLNEQLLSDYIDWIAARRMKSIGLPVNFKISSNPLPWTQRWISGAEVQVAPQETQISSYIVGGINKDWAESQFKNFKL